MFLNNLNNQQQAALLHTAKVLIEADHIILSSETDLFESLRVQCNANLEHIENFEISMLRNMFDTNQEKVSFLLELIAIAFIDDEYHEKEESLIDEIARLIGINAKKLGALESWVIRQTDLNNEALRFME